MKSDGLKGEALFKHEEELSVYAGRDRIISSHELAIELKNTDESVFKIDTGIKSLDRILGGVEAGELIIVTGPTGEGKTTLLMSITKNMAADNTNSVWFTLEVTPRQFLKKLVKANGDDDSKLPLFYIPRAGFEESDEEYVTAWEKKHRREYQMIDWIEDRIIEAKVKVEKDGKQLKAVFIDHIHMIFSLAHSKNISLEIGEMVAQIKNIALVNNLAIFLIAHLKDPSEGSMRNPRKEDIRDSGLIKTHADTIIGVWRIPNSDDGTRKSRSEIGEEDNKSRIQVFKNRRTGINGTFTMYHSSHYMTEDPFDGTDFA